jgi:signal transduction histidine kinase
VPKSEEKRKASSATGRHSSGPGELFRAVVDQLDKGVANVTANGEVLYCNPHFAEMMRYPVRGRARPTNLTDWITPNGWPALRGALREALDGIVHAQLGVEAVAEKPRMIQLLLLPVRETRGETIGVIATEVTEMVERAKALRETQASVANLSARLMRLQDEERRRIARDLHDVTGQELAVIGISLQRVADNYQKAGFDVRGSISESAELVRKVGDEIRTLSYLLHPPTLDELGLESALRWFCEGFAKRSGVRVEVEAEEVPRLSAPEETALFRVVQESLTNVFRHSGAQWARVTLSVAKGALRVSVEDHGGGLKYGEQASDDGRGAPVGVGIPGMRERMRQLGGELQMRSGPGGTTVHAILPLAMETRAEATPVSSGIPAERRTFPARGVAAARPEPVAAGCGRKRVLIVDDHDVVRRGMHDLLAREPDLDVCGEAVDGLDAVAKARELEPDLVILDLTMPRAGGLAAARNIRETNGRAIKILIFTTHTSPEIEKAVRAFRCDGYVLKSNAGQELIKGVRAVLGGSEFYSPAVPEQQSLDVFS